MNGLTVNQNKTHCFHWQQTTVVMYTSGYCDTTPWHNYSSKHSREKSVLYINEYMMFDTHINDSSKKVIGMLIYLSRIINMSTFVL